VKLLVLNFFPAFSPASSGGELRLGNLYRSLSRFHDITLLTSTDFDARFEEITHTLRFRELRFPKNQLWHKAYGSLRAAGISGELSGLGFALAVSDPDCDLRRTARRLAENCDAVIHEFPYSEPIFGDGSARFEIYNAHNFEAGLVSAIGSGPGFDRAILKVIRLERNLAMRAARVFAPSRDDLERFRLFYGIEPSKLALCPNGFDDRELDAARRAHQADRRQSIERPNLLFTGSAHYPNVEAARFLLELAPQLPDCTLCIAGGVATALGEAPRAENVTVIGSYSVAAKARLFADADLFLNPVILGSGTSLKTIEALGAGLPMVSTPEGLRGLDIIPGVHAAVVQRHDFASTIRRLIADPGGRRQLAKAGIDLALKAYTWDGIAAALAEQIERRPAGQGEPRRPFVLVLNDYPAITKNSGGVERIRGLLGNLDADIVLASFGPTPEFTMLAPGLLHITIPKSAAHHAFESAMSRHHPGVVNDGVASLFVASNRILMTLLPELANRAAAVVFEHCYMAPALDALRAVRPDLAVIYSAHNVEATLKAELLGDHPLASTFAAFIRDLEGRLIAQASLIVCCTELDAAYFRRRGAEAILVPNGCNMPASARPALAKRNGRRQQRPQQIRVGFIGSRHAPNVEAAEFVLCDLAPAFPDIVFDLVGTVCEAIRREASPNVRLHGSVESEVKSDILNSWSLALNPVASGGGSSLKLPDYMAHGLATLNTSVGARGVPVEEWDVGIVAERADFRDRLAEMLGDRERLARQSANALRCAKTYLDWRTVTAAYRERLRDLVVRPPPHSPRSLLVVTYRYTEPPLGGAEEYLVQVVEQLRPRFAKIDLAAVDTGTLTDTHHFGCCAADTGGGAAARIAELFDRAVFLRPDVRPVAEVLEIARRLERVWMNEERTLYAPFLGQLGATGRLRLLSGFFAPEGHDGLIRRWTAGKFCFAIPRGSRVIGLVGWTQLRKSLRLNLCQVASDGTETQLDQYVQPVEDNFTLVLALPRALGDGPVLLDCSVEEHHAEDDHRPLGIMLIHAYVLTSERGAEGNADSLMPLTERTVSLLEESLSFRSTDFPLWIGSLNNLARQRSAAVEADFAAVRGPHSAALQEWLAEHGADYDSVLVQGIPFDLIPSSIATLSRLPHRPRTVILPHFHGDDRFYYWRRYLESFEAADTTLLFSSTIADLIGPPEKFTIVPGGGVRSEELGDLTAIGRFREVCAATAPFFLVLGRKTPSKGYWEVLRAHAALRQTGIDADLVLIGPDEDGVPVDGVGVHYLGLQPREVIRGALSECCGLVNMSASESFGIVISEAWLFRKPVIANRVCYSFRELVRDETTGLLVGDAWELQEAMARLVGDPALCARLGAAGFVEAMLRYTWPQVAESIYRALEPDAVAAASGRSAGRTGRRRRSAGSTAMAAQTARGARAPASVKPKANSAAADPGRD
jgi:glycosyltransferase involved in cell wall biosynthesis